MSTLLLALLTAAASGDPRIPATGFVYHDANGNGRLDAHELGLAGVRVSNGREVALTDAEGRWRLPVGDDAVLFVIKPRGWRTPTDADGIPRFHYVHKPEGSPPLTYRGVRPTGPLPDSIDFPLYPQEEPESFEVLVFGDTQPRDLREVDYIAHDVVEPLIGDDAAFGLTLGDVVFDRLDLYPALNGVVGQIGLPWYNVHGNHDMNYDSPDDEHSDETWERVYGPPSYSFDYGPVHFVVMDTVVWYGAKGDQRGRYEGGFSPRLLDFVKNDLAHVPEEALVVFLTHIPLTDTVNAADFYALIADRPHLLALSAHRHFQAQSYLGADRGWPGARPLHQVICATVCGSWWTGAPDERGIPHATMGDGAPNGHLRFRFDGNSYSFEFRAAARPAEHQMAIHAPHAAPAGTAATVHANVFAGSERSVVELRLGGEGPWLPMLRVEAPDPLYAEARAREEALAPRPGRSLPEPYPSSHLWRAELPLDVEPGVRAIEVRTVDAFGSSHADRRLIRVLPR